MQEGWLRWFAHPSDGACSGACSSILLLLPTPRFLLLTLQKWFLGVIWGFSFVFFVSFGPEFAQTVACTRLFLVPYCFFVLSWCKLSQVPVLQWARLFITILGGWG